VVDGEGSTADYFQVVYEAIGRAPSSIDTTGPCPRFSADKIQRELGYTPRDRWREFLEALRELGVRSAMLQAV